jgi:RHS repeat-associated protein
MQMKNRSLIFVLFILVIESLQSQNYSRTQSNKILDTPVDEFTGTVAYSLPLTSVMSGDLKLDLGLVNHATGCKPGEVTFPVGEGWQLSAGGFISREVLSVRDEDTNGTFNGSPFHTGCSNLTLCPVVVANIQNGLYDTEADIFSFQAGEAAGKFYINRSQQIVLIHQMDVKITRIATSAGVFGSFIITTYDGTSYHYSAGEQEGSRIDSWVLDKIVSYDLADSIVLQYTPMRYGVRNLQSSTTTFPTLPVTSTLNSDIVSKLLIKIIGDHSTVDFLHNDAGIHPVFSGTPSMARKYYQIKETTGSYCVQWDLNHQTLSEGADLTGIRLTSMQKKSCNVSLSEPTTTFIYHNQDANFRPKQNTLSIDHWGYYNGAANTSLLPSTCYNSTCVGTAIRIANHNFSRNGVLTQVVDPTGGVKELVYEPQSNSSTTQSISEKLALETCTTYAEYYGTSCVGTNMTTSTAISFTTDELEDASVELCLSPDITNYSTVDPSDYQVNLEVYNSSNILLTSIGFNLSAIASECQYLMLKDIMYIGGGTVFFAGPSYIFRLTSENAAARLVINTYTEGYGSQVGGLRVVSVRNKDQAGTVLAKTDYQYEKPRLDKQAFYSIPGPIAVRFRGAVLTSYYLNGLGYHQPAGTDGFHMSYGKVTTSGRSPGKVVNYYHLPMESSSHFYNLLPPQLRLGYGALDSTVTLDATDNAVQKQIYSYTPIMSATMWSQSRKSYTIDYHIMTGIFRPTEVKTYYLDRLLNTQTIAYTYPHTYKPSITTTTTATGQLSSQYMAYTSDGYFGSGIMSYFSNKNIKTPYHTVAIDSLTDVRGSLTEYTAYSPSGAFLGTGGVGSSTSIIRPSKELSYQYTPPGSSTVLPTAWVEQHAYHQYTAEGMIALESDTHWPNTQREYSQKRSSKISYLSHHKKSSYKGSSTLVDTVYAVDGTYIVHEYDELMRLKRKVQQPRGIEIEYDYYYPASASDLFYTKETTSIPATDIRSALTGTVTYYYFDKLQRLVQTVHQQASPDYYDVITATAYDTVNRVVKSYLPVKSTYQDGRYVAPDVTWKHTATAYEASPLSRVTSTTPADWHPTLQTYGYNTAADAIAGYPAFTLLREAVVDAHGDKTISFTDLEGRKICLRKTTAADTPADRLDTYYQYDVKDRLTTVIPPGATASDANLTYSYTYDAEDKILTKKVPQVAPLSYTYNQRDHLIASQDGNLAAKGLWLAANYDDYGRSIGTGFVMSQPSTSTSLPVSFTKTLTTTAYGSTGIAKDKVIATTSNILGTNDALQASFGYDNYGFITNTTSNSLKNLSPASVTSTSSYDRTGLMLDQTTNFLTWQITKGYTYDHRGRQRLHSHQLMGGTSSIGGVVSDHQYNHRNETIRVSQGQTGLFGIHSYLQNIDYTYLTHGSLDAINQPLTNSTQANQACTPTLPASELIDTDAKKDIFYQKLSYDTGLPSGATARYTGQISADIWQIKGRQTQHYTHGYDGLGRLLQSQHYESNTSTLRYDQSQTYDKRGNILSMRRRGMADCATAITIDSLSYGYTVGSNTLASVTDQAPCPANVTLPPRIDVDQHVIASQRIYVDSTVVDTSITLRLSAGIEVVVGKYLGVKGSRTLPVTVDRAGCGSSYHTAGFSTNGRTGTYAYDANGNMTYDPYKQATIKYNHLDLPDTISWPNGNKIIHTYDAGGSLLRKRSMRGSTMVEDRYYIGSTEWLGDTLEVAHHAQGQYVRAGASYQKHYFILDHLANTRLVYTDTNGDGIISPTNEILQSRQYYPYGMPHQQKNNANVSKNDYLYNGIRLEEDFGLGLGMTSYRGLDPVLGRWVQVDPKVESTADINPYAAMNGDPVSYSDLFGERSCSSHRDGSWVK